MTDETGIFDKEDPEFGDRADKALMSLAADEGESVVVRGRAIVELGRRGGSAAVRDFLFSCVADPGMREKRWVGAVSLGWVAASALGFALKEQADRSALSASLRRWDPEERDALFRWAEREGWFSDVQ